MFKKDFTFDKKCKQKTFDGIQLMYNAVTRTLGPMGQNVLIDRARQVVDLTKDGVTVAEEVSSQDPFEEMGCKLAREPSQKTNDEAGNGTTSVIVIMRDICKNALELPSGASVIGVKRGMNKAVEACVKKIKEIAVPVKKEEDFRKIAAVSCQDEEMAETITSAFMKAGKSGSIDIERADKPGIETEKTNGISFDKGWLSATCINDRRGSATLMDVPVLVTDTEIRSQHVLIPYMQLLAEKGIKKLVVIADNIDGDGMGLINANNRQGSFHVIPIKAPSYGHNRIGIMKDIAEATNGTFVSGEEGIRIQQASAEHLGKAKKVVVTKDKTIIIADESVEIKKRISDRVDQLESLLDEKTKGTKEEEFIRKRLATLTDGITTIKVEGHTQQEYRELRFRAEDAIRALQAAREEGAVPGCGVAYLQCIDAVEAIETDNDDEKIGIGLVKKALLAVPLRILEVAGIAEKEIIVSTMKMNQYGYDFKTGKTADMMKLGIWDSAKSIRCCLEYGVSAAASFMTLGVSISCLKESDELLKDLGGYIKS